MPEICLFNGQIDHYEVDDFTEPWKADNTEIIVFQAGVTRHTEMLFNVVPLLSGKVRLIRRDLRGHGKSSIGDVNGYSYDLDTLVDEMADFVDKVAGRPVHWIGESTAGMLAIAFARKYPEKLRSLIVMSTPLVLGESFRQMTSEPYSTPGEAVRKLGLLEWQRSRPISRLAAQSTSDTNEMGAFSGDAYETWFEGMLQQHQTEGIALYFDFIMKVDVTDQLKHITVPTLVIAPRNSMASPLTLNEHITAEIQKSRMVIIDSVGHMVYMDQPQATCHAILDWIQNVGMQRI